MTFAPTQHYRAVFLSPHLDDAVFSCGGEIAKLRKEGKVFVLNIFTAYLENFRDAAVLLGPARYAEEAQAAHTLDYEYKNLGEVDVFFRHPRYRSIANVFRPMVKEDLTYLNTLKTKILDELAGLSFDRLYVPLAVGWHVDHCLVFLALQDLECDAEIYFYEDAPYCLIQEATTARLLELGWQRQSEISFLQRWWQVLLSFWKSGMIQNIPMRWVRLCSFPVMGVYLWGLLRSRVPVGKDGDLWEKKPILSEVSGCFELKMQAAFEYTSQVKEFFCGFEDMKSSYIRHSKDIDSSGKLFERFWLR